MQISLLNYIIRLFLYIMSSQVNFLSINQKKFIYSIIFLIRGSLGKRFSRDLSTISEQFYLKFGKINKAVDAGDRSKELLLETALLFERYPSGSTPGPILIVVMACQNVCCDVVCTLNTDFEIRSPELEGLQPSKNNKINTVDGQKKRFLAKNRIRFLDNFLCVYIGLK